MVKHKEFSPWALQVDIVKEKAGNRLPQGGQIALSVFAILTWHTIEVFPP